MTIFKCKLCDCYFEMPSEKDFNSLEEELWGHIQMEHEETFEQVEDLDTPDMLEVAYDKYT